jgi:hypothetical protein
MHIHQYLQSRIIIVQRHVSATDVAIIRVSYNRNTDTVQIIVQNCMLMHYCWV